MGDAEGGEPSGSFARSFAHLHVRSGFSYGHGTAAPEELAAATAGMGFGSLALTDRDGLYGVPRFLAACDQVGLSPIVGAEVSVGDGDADGGHVVLLAESMAGHRSLCRLITSYRMRTAGGTAAERRNPRATLQEVAEHAAGLVCLTGAIPFGFLPSLVLGGHARRAAAGISLLREAFGGRLYAEISDDGVGLPAEHRSGVGLSSMRERAEELDGKFSVESSPGGGTRVLARLPVGKE